MMKKIVFAVLSCILLFSCSALAADDLDYVEVDSQDAFDSLSDSNADYLSRIVESSVASGERYDLMPLASSSASTTFTPTLTLSGTTLSNGSKYETWLNFTEHSIGVSYTGSTTDALEAFSLSELLTITHDYVIGGFNYNCTYSGIAYFKLRVPRTGATSEFNYNPSAGFSPTLVSYSANTDPYPINISCRTVGGTDIPVYFSTSKTTNYTDYTFYVILSDYYVPSSYAGYSANNVVVSIKWAQAFQIRYYLNSTMQGVLVTPLTYFNVSENFTYSTRGFSGEYRAGRYEYNSDAISNAIENQTTSLQSTLNTISSRINLVRDDISSQTTSIKSAISSQTTSINSAISSQTSSINSAISSQTTSIKTAISGQTTSLTSTLKAQAQYIVDTLSQQTDTLTNSYSNEEGSSAISDGSSSVSSGIASEDSALDDAGSMVSDFDYNSGNLSSLATAFSLISGWFTSLIAAMGTFNMLVYVSLTLVVALFAIGYFRNK